MNTTENQAIYCLKAQSQRYSEVCEECSLYGEVGCDHCYQDAFDVAIQALEEIQQYQAIGTVEEIQKKIDSLRYDCTRYEEQLSIARGEKQVFTDEDMLLEI